MSLGADRRRVAIALSTALAAAAVAFAVHRASSRAVRGTRAVASAAPPSGSAKRKVSPMFVNRDVNHVLSTGQSLSVGVAGAPALSRTQPYENVMFSTGVIAGGEKLDAFVPLVEGRVPGGGEDVETMSSAFANLAARLARDELSFGPPGTRHDLLVSAHGLSGIPYSGLEKGTLAYANGIAQAKAGRRIAESLGKSYVVRAVTTVHGESDHTGGNTAYEKDLAEWQADYESDVRAITHQSEPIPMFETQMSSWTKWGQATSLIPSAQLVAALASHGKIVLVGPKYHLEYAPDGVHLTNEGYRHMGEDYAKAYRRVVLEGLPWEPLRPLSVTRAGKVITARMSVPAPPLVLDDTLVTNPGSYGFAIERDRAAGGIAPAITRVALAGDDTVTITLASEPTGRVLLRYAFSGEPGAGAGPSTGPRGNLRDSDATRSAYGHPLYNWCIHFEAPVE